MDCAARKGYEIPAATFLLKTRPALWFGECPDTWCTSALPIEFCLWTSWATRSSGESLHRDAENRETGVAGFSLERLEEIVVSSTDFDFLRQFLLEQSAIVLEPGKEYLVESRLGIVARREGLSSVKELVACLRSGLQNGLPRKIVDAMTTNETLFFRDVHPFETFKIDVLPELIAIRKQERRINIFSAACSSGQEPYSLAILIREHFPQLDGWEIRLMAADLSSEILERAKAGRYSQLEVNRGLPGSYLMKYFARRGAEWEIKKSIRDMVEFLPMNLAGQWPILPFFDVIFIRNVLIYFDLATKKQIIGRICRQLRQDGYLVLGGAETIFNIDESFEPFAAGKIGWYRPRRTGAA